MSTCATCRFYAVPYPGGQPICVWPLRSGAAVPYWIGKALSLPTAALGDRSMDCRAWQPERLHAGIPDPADLSCDLDQEEV